MSIANIGNNKISNSITAGFLDSFSKRGFFKFLTNIKYGRLIVEDGGTVKVFGQVDPESDIIAHISIHEEGAYRDMLFGGSIGAAESYMLGKWSSPNLVTVIRLMVVNLNLLNSLDNSRPIFGRLSSKLVHFFNSNTEKGSRKNISAHYDLGNDFFGLFLDSTMMYSSAIYEHEDTSLEEAAVYKLEAICKKLRLTKDDHLIEIGTGWGGLAVHAAKNYGCKVTTTTISKQQYYSACQLVKEHGLEDKITLLLQDYRELQGQYDKLVSVEMIEAVGHEYYESYFKKCSSLLKGDGLMLIQAITISDQRYHDAKNSVDFIQRYIFPGGCLPSNEIIAQCISKHTDMMIVGLQDIGLDYAKTLADWRIRFNANIDIVKQQGFDDVFCRMWEFYLCYCEGGFSERAISTAQIVFAKPHAKKLTPLS